MIFNKQLVYIATEDTISIYINIRDMTQNSINIYLIYIYIFKILCTVSVKYFTYLIYLQSCGVIFHLYIHSAFKLKTAKISKIHQNHI